MLCVERWLSVSQFLCECRDSFECNCIDSILSQEELNTNPGFCTKCHKLYLEIKFWSEYVCDIEL